MGGTKVDTEHLSAALSAYLLAGVYFGFLYWVLEQIRPGMFVAASNFSRTGAIYFSFVHAGNTWLWRYRTPYGCGTGPGNR